MGGQGKGWESPHLVVATKGAWDGMTATSRTRAA